MLASSKVYECEAQSNTQGTLHAYAFLTRDDLT